MVSHYKVIRDMNNLKKGDILTLSDDKNYYELTEAQGDEEGAFYYKRTVQLSTSIIDAYLKNNVLEAVDVTSDDNSNNKIDELKKLIASLKNTYNQRNENIQKKYNAGKLPTCQKVEHDTVYFNLMKLLNKFESIINE